MNDPSPQNQVPPPFDLAAEWARAKAVPAPGEAPVPSYSILPSTPKPIDSLPAMPIGQPIAPLAKADYKRERAQRQQAYKQADKAWNTFTRRWQQEANDRAFYTKFKEVQDLKTAYQTLEQHWGCGAGLAMLLLLLVCGVSVPLASRAPNATWLEISM